MPPLPGGVLSPRLTSIASRLLLIVLPAGACVPGPPAPWVLYVGGAEAGFFCTVVSMRLQFLHPPLPRPGFHRQNRGKRPHQGHIPTRKRSIALIFSRPRLFIWPPQLGHSHFFQSPPECTYFHF